MAKVPKQIKVNIKLSLWSAIKLRIAGIRKKENQELKPHYDYLEKYLESSEADNQYFSSLDLIYDAASIEK